jgi:hypothetical protein
VRWHSLRGLLTEYQHQAVGWRQTYLDVAVKSGGDLDDEVVVVFDVAVLDMDIAGRVLKDQLPYRWHHDLTPGVGDESVFDGRRHIDLLQCILDLGSVKDLGHIRSSRHRLAGSRC